jgi:hypothetical protein
LVTHAVREGAERNTGSSIEAENLGHVVGHSLQVPPGDRSPTCGLAFITMPGSPR